MVMIVLSVTMTSVIKHYHLIVIVDLWFDPI